MSKRSALTQSAEREKRFKVPVIDLTTDERDDDDNDAKCKGDEIFLLLDTSASMSGCRLESGLRALKDVLHELSTNEIHKDDMVTVMTFSGHPRFLFRKACASANDAQTDKSLQRIEATGGTALWDTVNRCIKQHKDVKIFIHCITDGKDNRSRTTQEDVESALQQNRDRVTLNIVFIGKESDEDADSYASVAQRSEKASITYSQPENLAQQSLTAFSQMY